MGARMMNKGCLMERDGFRQLVREMRRAQKVYFRTRSPEKMAEAKQLESRVDRKLESDGWLTLFSDRDGGEADSTLGAADRAGPPR